MATFLVILYSHFRKKAECELVDSYYRVIKFKCNRKSDFSTLPQLSSAVSEVAAESYSPLLMAWRVQNGLTALFIAQRLGYISVVEILRHITDVTVTSVATDDKYKVIAPETMQEAPMSDSEEEGGKSHCASAASFSRHLSNLHSRRLGYRSRFFSCSPVC